MPRRTAANTADAVADDAEDNVRELGADHFTHMVREMKANRHRAKVMSRAFLMAHKEVLRGIQQLVDEELAHVEQSDEREPPSKIAIE
jgi:hypothetical protein